MVHFGILNKFISDDVIMPIRALYRHRRALYLREWRYNAIDFFSSSNYQITLSIYIFLFTIWRQSATLKTWGVYFVKCSNWGPTSLFLGAKKICVQFSL